MADEAERYCGESGKRGLTAQQSQVRGGPEIWLLEGLQLSAATTRCSGGQIECPNALWQTREAAHDAGAG